MSPAKTIATCARTKLKPEDFAGPALDEVINMDREKNSANRKAKIEARQAAESSSVSGSTRR